MEVHFKTSQLVGGSSSQQESGMETIRGYHFEDGVLTDVYNGLTPGENGVCKFTSSSARGEIYFLANAAGTEGFDNPVPGTSLTDFLRIEASETDMTQTPLPMTGKLSLPAGQTVQFERSVARVDIEIMEEGVEVNSVTISGVADRGYVFPGTSPQTPPSAERGVRAFTFQTPPASGRKTLLYLCEQEGEEPAVEVIAAIGGREQYMKSVLPARIGRNKVYTLKIYGGGIKAGIEVDTDDWDTGSTTGSELQQQGQIDVEALEFPDGVRVSATRDTVFLPYRAMQLSVAVRAEGNTEVTPDGVVPGMAVTPAGTRAAKTSSRVSVLNIDKEFKPIDASREILHLNITRENVLVGKIVLVAEAHPVHLDGKISFDPQTRECDFGKYIDGELGVLTLSQGWTATLTLPQGEAPWIKFDTRTDAPDSIRRILGGWKPNDPAADGRTQTATLTVSDANGQNAEQYTIKRCNEGLPVVCVNGVWWCKYNLRGDSKTFSDQISIGDDATRAQPLLEYLQTCTDEELLPLLGEQYQGGYTQGLPLRYDAGSSSFYYEGMRSSGRDWGGISDTEMAPPGYRLPRHADYKAFVSGDIYVNLGGPGTHTLRNSEGENVTVSIIRREDISFRNGVYGALNFYGFRFGDETEEQQLVLCGTGHQELLGNNRILPEYIMLATCGTSGKSWYIKGTDNGNGNWFEFYNNNSLKTRTVRCLKIPVEYMY